jgi:hypothetical protein
MEAVMSTREIIVSVLRKHLIARKIAEQIADEIGEEIKNCHHWKAQLVKRSREIAKGKAEKA